MDSVHLCDHLGTLRGLRLMLARASDDGLDGLLDDGPWVNIDTALLVVEVAKLAPDIDDFFPRGKWATIHRMQSACDVRLQALTWPAER